MASTSHAASDARLSLADAVAQYLATTGQMTAASRRGYAAVLRELSRAFPDAELSEFEPPGGTEQVARLLDERWGRLAPRTYNKSVSILREFFAWHTSAGNLGEDPAAAFERKAVEPTSRAAISSEERRELLTLNAAPWDAVPLRLMLDLGIPKGPLRNLRFGDFDARERTVTFERGGGSHTLQISDEGFWRDLIDLRGRRRAAADECVVPKEISRKYNPKPGEIAAMKTEGILDDGTKYLWQTAEGGWERATIVPREPREDHGMHLWWYRCLQRAGLVPPGVTSGYPPSRARYTVGRRVLAETGRVTAVQKQLGLSGRRSGSVGLAYSNRDADQLEVTLRRLRRQVRRTSIPTVVEWWAEPVGRLVDHITEERDLVELSRVSIEVLRTQDGNSPAVRDAASTLTRVVKAADLIKRAHEESHGDHPRLHGHSLVAIWGAMETMVLDAVALWLQHWPAARSRSEIAEMKVPYGMFEAMSPEERSDALAQELDRQPSRRRGIDRFEALLEAVGLSGTYESILAQNIYEMQQIRHVFAHKQGIADRRFVEACPHLGYEAGQQILIDRDVWSDFMVNVLVYGELILLRMKQQLGVSNRRPRLVVRPVRHGRPATP